jgi:hypothetical protein
LLAESPEHVLIGDLEIQPHAFSILSAVHRYVRAQRFILVDLKAQVPDHTIFELQLQGGRINPVAQNQVISLHILFLMVENTEQHGDSRLKGNPLGIGQLEQLPSVAENHQSPLRAFPQAPACIGGRTVVIIAHCVDVGIAVGFAVIVFTTIAGKAECKKPGKNHAPEPSELNIHRVPHHMLHRKIAILTLPYVFAVDISLKAQTF